MPEVSFHDLAIYDPEANVGKCAEASKGKDTTTGHWEIAGLPTDVPFKTYPNGFPQDFMEAYQKAIGMECLGNYPASGTEIIEVLGDEHEATGKPIVYTSADSVFQIAMNVDKFGLDTLYHYCEVARKMLVVATGPAAESSRAGISSMWRVSANGPRTVRITRSHRREIPFWI